MKRLTKRKLLLLFTAVIIASTSIKVILGDADVLDRTLAVLGLIVFFIDQITR